MVRYLLTWGSNVACFPCNELAHSGPPPFRKARRITVDEQTTSTQSNGSTPESGTLDGAFWLLRALLRNWPIILAAVLLFGGASLLYSKTLPRIYEASALIEFDPDVIKPLGNKTDPLVGWSAVWDSREYYETQYKIMQSDRVLSAVVRNLSLQNDADFLGYKPTTPAPMENTVDALRGRLIIEPAKGSRLVYIKIQDTKPAQARRLSEAVARAYIQQNLDKMVSATGDTVVWLSGQLDHFEQELKQNENAIQEFKEKNELPSSTYDDLSKITRLEMQEYDGALTRTRMKRQELAARHAELAKITTENLDQIPASELLSNQTIQGLRTQYQAAIRERAELSAAGKGDNYPEVKRADEKIALARDLLVKEVKSIQGAVGRDLAIIQRQEAGEASLLAEARTKGVQLNLKELEYHRLDRMRAQNEKLYGVLLEQMKEADLRRMMNTNNIRLVDVPNEPKEPVMPRVANNVLVGLLAGLLLGVGLALLREQLDNTLKTPDDVENRLQVPFLGLLPDIQDQDDPGAAAAGAKRKKPARRLTNELAPELMVFERPTSGAAEAARALRTNLMFMNPDRPYRRILVTSAAPSEGKTTVAVSVAVSLAQGGQRVCIVDCDLRRPRLHRIFDRVGDVGITNVLLGDVTIAQAAKPTLVPNLFCLPCGPVPPSSADIVASEKFRRLLDELSEHFDRIVIDSPPVVAVTDSAILSTLVDGVVVVIRAFKTSYSLCRSGLRTLKDVDAPIAGAVLNAVNLDKHEYSYYRRYYYYKKEGYAPHPTPAAEHRAAPPN